MRQFSVAQTIILNSDELCCLPVFDSTYLVENVNGVSNRTRMRGNFVVYGDETAQLTTPQRKEKRCTQCPLILMRKLREK